MTEVITQGLIKDIAAKWAHFPIWAMREAENKTIEQAIKESPNRMAFVIGCTACEDADDVHVLQELKRLGETPHRWWFSVALAHEKPRCIKFLEEWGGWKRTVKT